MNNEPKAVNVLAMWGAAIKQTRERGGYPGLQSLDEGRAAVVELIEAVRKFDGLYQPETVFHMGDNSPDALGIFGVNGTVITLGDMRRLRSALARMQGGA